MGSVSYGSRGGERVVEGVKGGCWGIGEVVKLEMLAGLMMFLPLKYRK